MFRRLISSEEARIDVSEKSTTGILGKSLFVSDQKVNTNYGIFLTNLEFLDLGTALRGWCVKCAMLVENHNTTRR